MSWIEALKSSNLVWAILAICTIIGVPSFIYTVIKGKRKKEFAYTRSTFQVVNEGFSSISSRMKLLFDDKPIPNLAVTKFTIWNNGTEEIRHEDLYSDHPLCIKNTENAQILDATINPESNKKQKFKLLLNDVNDVEIQFECAEKKDRVEIQVVHRGKANELKPTVEIKGGREIREYESEFDSTLESKRWIFALVFGIILLVFIILLIIFIKAHLEAILTILKWVGTAFACIVGIIILRVISDYF